MSPATTVEYRLEEMELFLSRTSIACAAEFRIIIGRPKSETDIILPTEQDISEEFPFSEYDVLTGPWDLESIANNGPASWSRRQRSSATKAPHKEGDKEDGR
ncbi:hypothetical protein ACG7TL_003655 [Trametes sanguinea]